MLRIVQSGVLSFELESRAVSDRPGEREYHADRYAAGLGRADELRN
jgi:hypothetical protein